MAATRWEYRIEVVHLTIGKDDGVTSRAEAVSTLDALGREGWEVVGFSPSNASSHGLHVETTQYVAVLKRPSKDR